MRPASIIGVCIGLWLIGVLGLLISSVPMWASRETLAQTVYDQLVADLVAQGHPNPLAQARRLLDRDDPQAIDAARQTMILKAIPVMAGTGVLLIFGYLLWFGRARTWITGYLGLAFLVGLIQVSLAATRSDPIGTDIAGLVVIGGLVGLMYTPKASEFVGSGRGFVGLEGGGEEVQPASVGAGPGRYDVVRGEGGTVACPGCNRAARPRSEAARIRCIGCGAELAITGG